MAISVNLKGAGQGLGERNARGDGRAAIGAAGVTQAADQALRENLGIKTIRDLGSNK